MAPIGKETLNPTFGCLRARPDPALLSLVVPCYNEQQSLPLFAAEISRFIDELPYPCEVVMVNDGSTDRSLEFLAEWSTRDRRIKVLNLSRNFGHQMAATAGVDYTAGDAVVLMDADLQDPLNVIHAMVAQYRNGYDVVCGQRAIRADAWPRQIRLPGGGVDRVVATRSGGVPVRTQPSRTVALSRRPKGFSRRHRSHPERYWLTAQNID